LKHTAGNEHIGSMAALPPLEKLCGIGSLSPAGKCWEAATAQSRLPVRRHPES